MPAGAVYTGLAIGSNASGPLLYAANGAQNRIDVFNGTFAPANLGASAFVNPSVGTLVPFNVQNIGGNGGLTNTVYFADGINGEANGLFGSLAAVPEPASIALLGLGLAGLGFIRRRT